MVPSSFFLPPQCYRPHYRTKRWFNSFPYFRRLILIFRLTSHDPSDILISPGKLLIWCGIEGRPHNPAFFLDRKSHKSALIWSFGSMSWWEWSGESRKMLSWCAVEGGKWKNIKLLIFQAINFFSKIYFSPKLSLVRSILCIVFC